MSDPAPMTATAERVWLSERREPPGYEREVLMTLRIGDDRLHLPIDDPRTLDTLGKRLPLKWRVTVSPE